ncbi:MAG TPA: hypothetical protein VGR95_17455 [Thermoanaerobaculia bacterium]|nr:hypothetical protein [Thermoanaerobaculia bacterium]
MKALLALIVSAPLFAQSVASTPRGVLIAHDNVIELHGKWKTEGVSSPGAIAISNTKAAVLDEIHDRVAIVDLANGMTTFANTRSTPIAAAFVNNDLLVLDRDAHVLEKIGGGSIQLAEDPEFLAIENGKAYVYSRIDGVLQEIGLEPFALLRTVRIAPFATAMQCDARSAYLVYPRDGRVRVVDLAKMQAAGEFRVGSVPTDIAIAGDPTALTATVLAIADPSAKRVWLVEGSQSSFRAFTRGFLRGIIGLGLFGGKETEFPTGVDRVIARGGRSLAFDASTGTLYSVTKNKTNVLAGGLGPNAFALTPEGVAYWQNGTLVAEKLSQ